MDIKTTASLLNTLLPPELQKPHGTQAGLPSQVPSKSKSLAHGQDLIQLSKQKAQTGEEGFQPKHTRLIAEETEEIENGFRRTQKFIGKDGRQFIRIEEFTSSADRSKRIVVQQNSSGNTTILEDILDRQQDGTFRLTQRFTDETGATKTNIEFNVTPNNADIILGRTPAPEQQNAEPFEPSRGTQFDVSA